MTRPCDLVGSKFEKLTVISRNHENTLAGKARWVCRCDCGSIALASTNQLKTGRKKSCGCLKILPFGEGSFNSLFMSYKRGARSREIDFEISKDTFRLLTKGNCFYCGKSPENNYKSNGCRGHYSYNGVDRVDNSKGYVQGNVVSCCTYCNRAKNNRPETEFLSWISSVFIHTIQMNKAV